ncbi:TPA: Rha family transcriptional regulator, partial [Haemophilus influenzae]
MNQLLTISKENTSTLTMSSREIAELINKNHSDLCRSIERLIAKEVIWGYQPMAYTHPQNGQTYYEYHLTKRDSLIVVAQNCPEFTAAIVDRWQALENQQKPTALIPQSFSEALMLAAQLQAEKERNAPKVAFVDHYVEVGTSKSFRETAKI